MGFEPRSTFFVDNLSTNAYNLSTKGQAAIPEYQRGPKACTSLWGLARVSTEAPTSSDLTFTGFDHTVRSVPGAQTPYPRLNW